MGLFLVYLILFVFRLNYSTAITTIHHDKPDSVTISTIKSSTLANIKITAPVKGINITISPSERRKRLLPYQNFYFDQPFNRPHQAGVSAQQYKDYENVRPQKKPEANSISFRPSGHKFTPFLEANAIPGPFHPMVNPSQSNRQKYEYIVVDEPTKDDNVKPDLASIYDKLSQLKLRQQNFQRKPEYGYRVPTQHNFRERPQKLPEYRPYEAQRYKIQPTKTTIETFTATNIDIPETGDDKYEEPPRYHQIQGPIKDDIPIRPKFRENSKPYIQHQIAIEVPQSSLPLTFKPTIGRKPPNSSKDRPRTYLVIQQGKNSPKQPTYIVRKPKPNAVVEESYVAEKLVPVVYPKHQNYQPHKPVYVPLEPQYEGPPAPIYENNYEENYQATPVPQVYQQQEYQQTIDGNNYVQPETATPEYNDNRGYYQYQPVTPEPSSPRYREEDYQVPSSTPRLEKAGSLSDILKQLQESNTLPQTLTSDNIDNSIKTLVKILHALRDRQKQQKPVVVEQEDYEYDNEAGVDLGGDVLDNPDGGTPGKPGVDYPALSSIPKTSFSCKTQRYKGFFGDPDTNCQVWHYCDLNGGQASFLCPNGTIFSQVALTCDWWFNVKCASTAQLYVLNERLYKYIIPLSPKFPEDYSGPLVDKYLAMKFQEMEEKLKKQKKGKGNTDSKEDDDGDDGEEEEDDGESVPTKEESQYHAETEEQTTESSEIEETTNES